MENLAKRGMVIINPISGTRSKRGLEDLAAEVLGAAGFALDFVYTGGPDDAPEFAGEAVAGGYDAVITAGGDGTVNEVAKVLLGSSVAMGIIPCGSGNGLARSLGVPSDFKAALKIVANGHTIVADSGDVNSTPFFCTFGVGFDAAVSEKFAGSRRRGRVSYVRNVLREFVKYTPESYAISINGTVITEKAFLIAACNASQYGNNAYIAPKASLTDGLLDLTVIHSGSPFSTALVGVDLLTGYLDRNTLIDTFRISSATITRLHGGPAHVDGEPVELGRNLEIMCRPASLKLYAPEVEYKVRPLISPIRSFLSDIGYDFINMFRQK